MKLWMLIQLFADIAEACSPPGSQVMVLTEPRSEQGFWVHAVDMTLDLGLDVDGIAVESDVTTFQDPAGFSSTFALFTPRTPLAEGQEFRITAAALNPPEVVGVVGGPIEGALPSLDAVEIGEFITGGGGSCLNTGKYRFIELSLSGGEGLVLLDDEQTGERVKVAFVDAQTSGATFLREGRSASAACLIPTVVSSDGAQAEMDAVCSPSGCSSSAASGSGAAWVVGGLLARRRQLAARSESFEGRLAAEHGRRRA